jgi:gamma-glutamyltranspeptidase/glutathione hydrolase
MMFQKGGNVDAAAAMFAAGCTMWDTLAAAARQALIYNPKTKKVIGLNALGAHPWRAAD